MKRDTFLPLLGVAGLIAVWYLAVWARVVDPVLLPSPDQTFAALVKGMAGGKLGHDFWRTVERTAYATAIAAVIAIPLGVLLGANEKAYRAVEFVIDLFRSTPASAMFPLFLVIFSGVGDRGRARGTHPADPDRSQPVCSSPLRHHSWPNSSHSVCSSNSPAYPLGYRRT